MEPQDFSLSLQLSDSSTQNDSKQPSSLFEETSPAIQSAEDSLGEPLISLASRPLHMTNLLSMQYEQNMSLIKKIAFPSMEPFMKIDQISASLAQISIPPPYIFDELTKASDSLAKNLLAPSLAAVSLSANRYMESHVKVFQSQFDAISQTARSAMMWNINLRRFDDPQLMLPTLMLPTFTGMESILSMNTFLPDMSWITSLTDQLNTILRGILDEPLTDLRLFKKNLKQRIIAAFRMVGLCFAPSMSEDLMYKVLDYIESSGKKSTVTLIIWNYYARHNHRHLQQAIEKWQDNPEFARRWHDYLYPAFEAHMAGRYGLSISALLPMVEGISSHIVKENNLKPPFKPRKGTLGLGSTRSVIERALAKAGDVENLEHDAVDLSHWVRVKSALAFAKDDFCVELDFEKDYDFIHQRSRKLTRHGLLHGIQTGASTAFNSLRLFLLLDTMFYLLQHYAEHGGHM